MKIEYFPTQKYNTIVIDPPWDISMAGKRKLRKSLSKELPYKTMTIKEIEDLPIESICNEGTHVYLWATNKTLEMAFDIFRKWNINFHLVLVWVKPSMLAPSFGYMFATEFCLLGYYKKATQRHLKMGVKNWFEEQNKPHTHSKKPDQFYKLVADMSPEPRIDIFARIGRKGWDVFGDEIPICPKCKNILIESDLKEYSFLCERCDENFYSIEVVAKKSEIERLKQ